MIYGRHELPAILATQRADYAKFGDETCLLQTSKINLSKSQMAVVKGHRTLDGDKKLVRCSKQAYINMCLLYDVDTIKRYRDFNLNIF